jgi:hypothetical protein
LHQSTKASFCRIESYIARPPAQRSAGACEEERAGLFGQHSTDCLSTEQKAPKADNPPALLKIASVHVGDFSRCVVSGIVDRNVQIGPCRIEQLADISLAGRVRNNRHRLPARSRDILRDGFDGRLRSAGNE